MKAFPIILAQNAHGALAHHHRPPGPIGHLPLSLQILLGACILATGFGGLFYTARNLRVIGPGEAALYPAISSIWVMGGVALIFSAIVP